MSRKNLPPREAIGVGRFSTDMQDEGDSVRRQQNSFARVCQRRELEPSSRWAIFDRGLSGLKGEHLSERAELGKFIRALEAGQVKPDAYGRMPVLVWEAVDRMTRLPQLLATDLVRRFVNAGVTICFDEADLWIDKATIEDQWILLQVLIDQAYQFSRRLSRRLKSAWHGKREKAAAGKKFGRRRPSWLDWDEARQAFVENAGADAVRFVFQQTAEGCGQRRLLGRLQKRHKPIGTSKRWNTSFLQAVLNDRAVLGELQPCQFDDEGRRVPVGEPIHNYYPAVVDEPLWYRAQAAKANNFKAKGANGDFINLFKGLVFNATDGHKMHLQTCRSGKSDEYRRLVSYGHTSKEADADPVGVPYIEFEDVLLSYLQEVKAEDVQPRDNGAALVEKEKELVGVRQRLDELAEALADESADTPVPVLASAVGRLTTRKTALRAEIEKLKEEGHAERPLAQTQSVIPLLASVKGEELKDLRLRLRSMIADLVESIYVKAERVGHSLRWLVQVNFKNGRYRQINHSSSRDEMGRYSGCTCGPVYQLPADHLRPDLRDRDAAKALHFSFEVQRAADAPPVIPAEPPKELAAAAQLWLQIRRAAMKKDSFRVVPSKIERFVEFVGADAHASDVDGPTWRRWVRFLKGQVSDGELAQATARVTYGRSREFVCWLVKNGLAKDFDELEPAGTEAVG